MVYFDLNIKSQDVTKREFMSSEIEKCGYKCIALNYECHVGERPVDVEKMAPFDHLNPQIRQLKRLTLHMDSMTSVYSLTFTNKLLQPYDLIAVQAESGPVFEYLCTEADIDLIVIDASRRQPFAFRKSWISAALKRNIQFEISYGTALSDTSSRQYFISNLISLVKATNGRNIILSSGVSHAIFLRSPYEATSLAIVAGLNHSKAMDMMCLNPKRLIERIDQRKESQSLIK